MLRSAAVAVALTTVLLGGCADGAGGRLICAYHPGGDAASSAAPYRADYALYQEGAGGRQDDRPLLWRGLAPREAVGFEKGAGGLMAVAGADRIPLAEAAYRWRSTPETEPSGADLALHEAGTAVTTAARFCGGLALGVVLLPVIVLWRIPVSPFPF